MENNKLIEKGIKCFVNREGTVLQISKLLKIKQKDLREALLQLGYKANPGIKVDFVISLKNAVDEYIKNINNNPSLTKIGKKWNIGRNALSKRLKELGIVVINHQNKVKFNEHIFDSIDTEEKAYWLGFIFADGYVSSTNNKVELSLKSGDTLHLEKFNKFMGGASNKVKIGKSTCGNVIYERCRWFISNKHLKETLISYGCTPNKSLVLKFPNESIFKNKLLIRHFIRGYIDGDGCLSYGNKNHTEPTISILGTRDFLEGIERHIPELKNYSLHLNDKNNDKTFVLSATYRVAFRVTLRLYKNSTIYLERKYEKYLEFCRLYEKSYRLLETNIGEGCDANPEVTTEIKESVAPQSVEIEPEKSE